MRRTAFTTGPELRNFVATDGEEWHNASRVCAIAAEFDNEAASILREASMDRTKDRILEDLVDLHKQATTDRSHYYVAGTPKRAIEEIKRLRIECTKIEALEVQLMSHGIDPVVRHSD
jgi:hypothetical protein